ncbi:MAG: TrkH family potassium uptake protein [Planctomycetota bacterium]|nr:TrkH family potassium uptake protein [Planctomycetota bacterium]
MRLGLVFGLIGQLLRLFSAAFLVPLGLALAEGDYVTAGHFAISLAIAAGTGWLLGRRLPAEPLLQRAEALAIVAGTWLVVAAFAGLPYVFAGIPPVDAMFESMSGLTTTGATILEDFSAYGDPFFLWRAMTQWFGGLGVIALFVVVLPRLGIAGRQLFFAEASISTSEGISPQIRGAARKLWVVYVGLTVIQAALLYVVDFSIFDAVVHALTTMSAGGFSPHPRSIEGYANPRAEWVFIVFMVLSGTSFPLLWRLASGRVLEFFRDGEFLVYLTFMVLASLVVAWMRGGLLPGIDHLRAAAFQVASITSSTGYASEDYELWAWGPKAVLLVVLLMGGCAGSACGGPKVIRWILTFKFLRREMTQTLHPTAVMPLRYRRRPIGAPIARAVLTLILLYVLGYIIVGLLLMMTEPNLDLSTAFSASLACFGNVGPAFGAAGPMGNYTWFTTAGKLLLTASMWLGRLEIVTVIALLQRDVWKHTRWGMGR